MSNEKRGTEKLLDVEDGLCSLTEDELAQVAGGYTPAFDWPEIIINKPLKFKIPYFPKGMFPPDLIDVNFGNHFGNRF